MRTFSDNRILETILQDVYYAVRILRQNPLFVTTAVLTLALAIGGNTAMFTIIRAVLLNPLQYPDSDKLVRIAGGATPTRFAEMQTAALAVAELGAYTSQEDLTLSGDEPEIVKGTHVSASFLPILRVHPLLGRGFLPTEDTPGGPPVALISSEFWQRRFSSDPQIIGKTAVIGDKPYTIVGVLPPRFQFPSPGLDIWLTQPSDWQGIAVKSRVLSPFLTIFGRLKPGVTLDRADAQLRVIRRQYAMAHPSMLDAKAKAPREVTSLKEQWVSTVRSMLWLLFGAVGFVLMIACANLANLLIASATYRQREFALRSALGASRDRLVRQLLTESVLLSALGGTVGVLLAALALRATSRLTAVDLPRLAEIRLDWVVLGFAVVLSIATGLIFGLAPSLGASRPDLTSVLRASGVVSAKTATGSGLRNLLSVGQVALSIVLLIGATLLLESVARLRDVPVGFNAANLLTVSVSLPTTRYDTDWKVASFYRDLSERIEFLPGVRGAAVALTLPMMGYPGTPVQDAAKPKLPLNQRLIAKIFLVTPHYFRTLEIPLERGREFTENDKQDTQRVAIIDETLARRLWPAYPAGLNPIGQRIWVGGINPKPAEIVGVVSNVKQNLDDRQDWQESVYVSFAQNPAPSAMIAVRTASDPVPFAKAIRQQIQALDRDQPIGTALTMEDRMEAQVGQRRLLSGLLTSFSIVALLLALIGIYGVVAYSVAQRTQEMGVRRALGAQTGQILRLILGQGAALALAGTVVGILGALALSTVIRSLLFQVNPTDPLTFIAVPLLFLLVALVASYVPAQRATRVDPIAALRVS